LLVGERPTLIKIDVEGFECNVIMGLSNTINANHPFILTEIVPRHLAACGTSVEDLVRLLRGFGYQGFRLSLKKDFHRYTWTLKPLNTEDSDYDALWIHHSSKGRHLSVLSQHM